MPGKELVPLTPAVIHPAAVDGAPWPQQERQSEAAVVTISRWARRNNHVTVPMALLPALWLAGLALHQARAALYVALCGGVLAACVWFFAPHKWTGRDGKPRTAEVWYARLSAALSVAWLTAAAWLGPLSGFWTPVILASLLTAGCIAWGVPWWQHKRPRGMKKREQLIAWCDAWWQSHAPNWNLRGSRVIDADKSRVTLRIRVRGLAGRHTLLQFRQLIPFIESAAEGWGDIGRVRVEPVKGHPSEFDIYIKQDNPLRGVVEYDPEIAPRSVHDPEALGRTETGEWHMVPQRKNRFVNGATRTGKSNDLLNGVANLSGCRDARFVLIDLKGGRSARPVLKSGTAEYVITEVDGLYGARMYLRMGVAEAKARQMGAYDGNEQLHATEDTPAWFTLVDETHGLTATEDGAGDTESRRHLSDLASQGAGVEMYERVYTQHGSLESSVGTEQIRANLTLRICFRVEEPRHGAYVIEEYHRLDASKLEEKGTCYVKDGPKTHPEQVRTPLIEHAFLEQIASQNAALLGPRPPVRLWCGDQVAYQTDDGPVTWQQWWDDRWLHLHPAFRADSPQYQAAAAGREQDPDMDPDGLLAAISRLVRDGIVTPDDMTPGTLAKALAAHEKTPSPPNTTGAPASANGAPAMDQVPDDFRPDPKLVKRLPQVIASQTDLFCDTLEAATQSSPVTPADLIAACGMSRSWVFDRLGALAEIGVVTQVSRGRYAMVPGSDIRIGLAEIKARNDRLAREAAELVNAG